mmetsp:Transcript_24873/g.47679  ORF Transcript_24873/g.47679 Transcript_24873/m.47679 type:complete len:100 (-) Transcript_24873:268-567(-)
MENNASEPIANNSNENKTQRYNDEKFVVMGRQRFCITGISTFGLASKHTHQTFLCFPIETWEFAKMRLRQSLELIAHILFFFGVCSNNHVHVATGVCIK